MADGMSFDKYIDNPSGGASVVTNRSMYKKMYKDKFDKVLLREGGKINFAVYRTKDKYDSYYIYLKIPSEVVEEFYYDVVIQLYTTENIKKSNNNLRLYAVKFFSNDPAFVYTFAYAFNKNNLFISDLKSKMSNKAIRTPAKTKNPKNDVWYVKSLFFAYLAMEKYGLFSKITCNRIAKAYDKRELLKRITPTDIKIQKRTEEGEKQQAAKKKEKLRELREKQSKRAITNPTAKSSTSSASKKVSTVKKSKITKAVTKLGKKQF